MTTSTETGVSEPAAQRRGEPDACRDCGTLLQGEFCHRCGQRRREPIGPLREVAREALDAFLDLDRRLYASLKALLLQPARLSREYVAGHRTRWVGPFRLYLITSVVYFVVREWSGTQSFLIADIQSDAEGFAGALGTWLPRIMFVVVPLFAGLIALIFRRVRRHYVEHLVFAVHLQAAWFALLSVETAAAPFLPQGGGVYSPLQFAIAVPVVLSQLWVLVYTWLALRRFYGLPRLATTWRAALAVFGYALILALAIVGVGLLSGGLG